MSYSSWIDKEFKKHYNDSSKNGIRLFFDRNLSNDVKNEVKNYVRFLRNNYFFPVRCYIHFTNNYKYYSFNASNSFCYGIFFTPEESRGMYPSIFLPSRIRKKDNVKTVLSSLTILLTYYFQWYFFEDKKRSQRSLNIEANEYVRFLIEEYNKEKM